MTRQNLVTLLATTSLLGSMACNQEQGTVFIQGARVIEAAGGSCSAGDTFLSSSILDIGANADDSNPLTLALTVVTNLPAAVGSGDIAKDETRSPSFPDYGNSDTNIITFTGSETFFSTDLDGKNIDGSVDPALKSDKLPSTANPQITSVGGTVFNKQGALSTTADIFANAITVDDTNNLKKDPLIIEELLAAPDPAKLFRIIVNTRVLGITTGGATVRSPPFPFPVDLCSGCLLTPPTCVDGDGNAVDPIRNDQACFLGQDQPAFVCPE